MFAWLDRFLEMRSVAKAEREANRPRVWKFVNAYGPDQCLPRGLMSYNEALKFLKENVGCPFVQDDIPNGIIFFDGRRKSAAN